MKVNNLDNLWVGYNETENISVLICALDIEEAREIINVYSYEHIIDGEFEISKFTDLNTDFSYDYVLTYNGGL